MNSIQLFKHQLSNYLTKGENQNVHLVKFDVSSESDFSFITNLSFWSNYIKNIQGSEGVGNSILNYAANEENEIESIEKLKIASEDFAFQINYLEVRHMKCFIKVMRNSTFKEILEAISSGEYGKMQKSGESISVQISDMDVTSITNFRIQTIASVLKKLLNYSPYNDAKPDTIADCNVLLTTRSNLRKDDEFTESTVKMLCGVVCDKNDKKMSQTKALDYIKHRCNDMYLIAVHKYGIRSKSDRSMKSIEDLGKAACKLDMVEVKVSSPLVLSYDAKQAFVLYNSARIENLLANFEKQVAKGYYPPLPKLEEIDFNIFTDDEEWLLLKQLMLFPEIIQNSLVDLKNGKISIHLIYKYLQTLASVISNFYAKKKVLTENRAHLMPVLHAKIHLLKAVQVIFNSALDIFNIQPVSFM